MNTFIPQIYRPCRRPNGLDIGTGDRVTTWNHRKCENPNPDGERNSDRDNGSPKYIAEYLSDDS